jgi:DNA-binding MarR family transcriptional regulator
MNDYLADAFEAEVLAQYLIRFAAQLRRRSDSEATEGDDPTDRVVTAPSHCASTHLELARKMYRARRMRDRHLPSELFGEPAWDLLLDLYTARLEQRDISVTSAAVASCVPATTALRWIALTAEHGLIERCPAPHDGRVQYLRLTALGSRRMQRYLQQAQAEVANGTPPFLVVVK